MEDINCWQSKYQSCEYSDRLMNKLYQMNQEVHWSIDLEEVRKGIYYAKKYHGSQMRQSGEPYYSHPIAVADMVAEYAESEIQSYFRNDMIITALLHDTIEDTELTKEMIAKLFGYLISSQVEDLTRIKINKKISAGETVNLLFSQYKKDVLCIKLFDRLHNMRTIYAIKTEKAKQIIDETLAYFIPLSCYLNIYRIEQELLHLCYEYLNIKLDLQEEFSFDSNSQIQSLNFQNDVLKIQALNPLVTL